jgi:glucose-6-phosphate 1-dehydrogenase
MDMGHFKAQISRYIKGEESDKQKFLERCYYVAGAYDSVESFEQLAARMTELEATNKGPTANRLFYFAIPPAVFMPVANSVCACVLVVIIARQLG